MLAEPIRAAVGPGAPVRRIRTDRPLVGVWPDAVNRFPADLVAPDRRTLVIIDGLDVVDDAAGQELDRLPTESTWIVVADRSEVLASPPPWSGASPPAPVSCSAPAPITVTGSAAVPHPPRRRTTHPAGSTWSRPVCPTWHR